MTVFQHIDSILTRFIRFILGATSAVIFLVTFLAVVFRYLLKSPLPGSHDVIRLAFTYMIFLVQLIV